MLRRCLSSRDQHKMLRRRLALAFVLLCNALFALGGCGRQGFGAAQLGRATHTQLVPLIGELDKLGADLFAFRKAKHRLPAGWAELFGRGGSVKLLAASSSAVRQRRDMTPYLE